MSKNRKSWIIRIMSNIQEENICNFIIECCEKNKAIRTKSFVCYDGKINS